MESAACSTSPRDPPPLTALTPATALVAMPRADHLRVVSASPWPEADDFCDRARRHALFAAGEPIVVARAPGRFDVLGGIADYSGALVLELPIASAALVAAQVTSDRRVIAVSGGRR